MAFRSRDLTCLVFLSKSKVGHTSTRYDVLSCEKGQLCCVLDRNHDLLLLASLACTRVCLRPTLGLLALGPCSDAVASKPLLWLGLVDQGGCRVDMEAYVVYLGLWRYWRSYEIIVGIGLAIGRLEIQVQSGLSGLGLGLG